MPAATDRPCPRDPVATSTNGIFGTGCPSIIESFNLRERRSFSVIIPAR